MSRQRETVVTVVALVVLASTIPSVLALADVRERQATDQQRQDLIDSQVTARQAANDYDGDGIPDGNDTCPTRPETDNGYQDGDGCPDVVATTGAS
ncbi:MAG: thrombospondin type 3 repeat-containing protein [Haloarculaceae archaeon]